MQLGFRYQPSSNERPMNKNFVVVGTCQKLLRQVLVALRSETDANCVVIGGENTRNLKWSSLCSRNYVLNLDKKAGADDDARFTTLLHRLAREFPDAILIPADCEGTRAINRVKPHLPDINMIPHADLSTLDTLDNKWRFFQFCSANSITVPDTVYIGPKSSLNYPMLAERLGVPFVIKPVNQAGSTGVLVVHNEAFFNRAILENEAYQFDSLIAQKYIEGIDLCFNFFAMEGEISAFTIQQRIGSTVSFLPHPQLEQLGRHLAKAARYSGVMCVDARVEASTGKVYLIESNPRFWASLGASVWCGVNFVTECIQKVRRRHAPRTITSGTFNERHPVLRPAAWSSALFDLSARGRIVRAQLRDLPVVSRVVISTPMMLLRYTARRAGRLSAPNTATASAARRRLVQ